MYIYMEHICPLSMYKRSLVNMDQISRSIEKWNTSPNKIEHVMLWNEMQWNEKTPICNSNTNDTNLTPNRLFSR